MWFYPLFLTKTKTISKSANHLVSFWFRSANCARLLPSNKTRIGISATPYIIGGTADLPVERH